MKWMAGILAAAALVAVPACSSDSKKADDETTTTTAATAATTESTAATTPTTTAPAAAIFEQTGSGTANTANFRVPDDWDLAWTYDCSKFPGGTGNLIVMIYDNDDGQQLDFDNQGVNQLGQNGAGTEHYHSGGNQKFLKVVSTCDWTIKVTKA
jgi:hypothetical protein